jgi:hypothetical protein
LAGIRVGSVNGVAVSVRGEIVASALVAASLPYKCPFQVLDLKSATGCHREVAGGVYGHMVSNGTADIVGRIICIALPALAVPVFEGLEAGNAFADTCGTVCVAEDCRHFHLIEHADRNRINPQYGADRDR